MLTDQDIYLFREGTHGRLLRPARLRSVRRRRRRAVCRLGAQRRRSLGHRRLERLECGATGSRRAPDGSASGKAPFRAVQRGPGLQIPNHVPQSTATAVEKADPFGIFCELPPATASRVWTLDYDWTDAAWMRHRAAARNGLDAPMSIYELHVGIMAPQGRQFPQLPRIGPCAGGLPQRSGLHACRTDAHHRAPFLRLMGISDDGLFRAHCALRHAAGFDVLRRSSAPARHRRDSRLGAVALSRRRSMGWRISTARTSMSTPIRARAFIPSGTPRSSITAATRCAAFSSPRRCSGSRTITSTGCAWTRWPPCCISTTRAKKASGYRIASAAAKISTPSISCAS